MPSQTSPGGSDLFEWLKIGIQAAGYIIGWLIVIKGWNVSQSHNRSRDERKDLRDRVNEISDLIRNVEADVVSFLTTEDATKAASFWTVHFGVQRVNLAIVSTKDFETPDVKGRLIDYRQAITLNAVIGPTTPPKPAAQIDRDLRKVAKTGNALIRALEGRFSDVYSPKSK